MLSCLVIRAYLRRCDVSVYVHQLLPLFYLFIVHSLPVYRLVFILRLFFDLFIGDEEFERRAEAVQALLSIESTTPYNNNVTPHSIKSTLPYNLKHSNGKISMERKKRGCLIQISYPAEICTKWMEI